MAQTRQSSPLCASAPRSPALATTLTRCRRTYLLGFPRMSRLLRPLLLAGAVTTAAAALVFGLPVAASAHDERDATAPSNNGKVPEYRTTGTTLLVCKADKADFDRRIAAFPNELRTINLTMW